MALRNVSGLRSLLRELRLPAAAIPQLAQRRAARAMLHPAAVSTLLGQPIPRPTSWDGHALYCPQPMRTSTAAAEDGFRSSARRHLARSGVLRWRHSEEDAAAMAAATVALSQVNAKALNPAPLSTVDDFADMELIRNEANVRAGDLLVAHPYMTHRDGSGGCIALVLRHSFFDTLALVLNVDAGVDEPQVEKKNQSFGSGLGWSSLPRVQRPHSRIHLHLPPLASTDPRKWLPAQLHDLPLRLGGTHPVPLHLLHSIPLVSDPMPVQVAPYQRLTGHYVCPGIFCSYVDGPLINAAAAVLESGEAHSRDFGAFVGMLCWERNQCGLGDAMRRNQWLAVRPHSRFDLSLQGWGSLVRGAGGEWEDDRDWDPWRRVLRGLGGEFKDWADTDWLGSGSSESITHRSGIWDATPTTSMFDAS